MMSSMMYMYCSLSAQVLVTDKFDLSYNLVTDNADLKKWAPPESWQNKLATRNTAEELFTKQQGYIKEMGEKVRSSMDDMQNFSVAIIDTWKLDRDPGPYREKSRDVPKTLEGTTINWKTANESWRKVWSKNVDSLVNRLTFDEPRSNCGYLFPLEMPEGASMVSNDLAIHLPAASHIPTFRLCR